MVRCLQINLGKRVQAIRELEIRLSGSSSEIVFIQEPSQSLASRTFFAGGMLLHIPNNKERKIRSAIWIKDREYKAMDCRMLNQFTDEDIVTVSANWALNKKNKKKIVFCSWYAPSFEGTKLISNPINEKINAIRDFCERNNFELIISTDSNSHHPAWGEIRSNNRGVAIHDWLLSSNLFLLNQGSTPTFTGSIGKSIIDLTIAFPFAQSRIKRWKVLTDESHSDHRYISFELVSSLAVERKTRIKKRTDWIKYKRIMESKIAALDWKITDKETLEEKASILSKLMTDAHAQCCKEKVISSKGFDGWYDDKLKKTRKNFDSFTQVFAKQKKHKSAQTE
jgi:hypothetical protein